MLEWREMEREMERKGDGHILYRKRNDQSKKSEMGLGLYSENVSEKEKSS